MDKIKMSKIDEIELLLDLGEWDKAKVAIKQALNEIGVIPEEHFYECSRCKKELDDRGFKYNKFWCYCQKSNTN